MESAKLVSCATARRWLPHRSYPILRRGGACSSRNNALWESAERICADARAIDAAAEATRGLVTPCESDTQGREELGAEINLISASDSLPLENPPLLKKSTVRTDSVLNLNPKLTRDVS